MLVINIKCTELELTVTLWRYVRSWKVKPCTQWSLIMDLLKAEIFKWYILYYIYDMTYILPVGKIPLLYYIYNWHCIFKPYLKHFVELISHQLMEHGLIFMLLCLISEVCARAAERDIWLMLQATVFNSIPPTSAIIGYNAIGLWKLPAVKKNSVGNDNNLKKFVIAQTTHINIDLPFYQVAILNSHYIYFVLSY